MTKTNKAVLSSAFIFPGIGHLLFKRYIVAICYAIITLSTLVPILSMVIDVATDVAQKIVTGEVEPNILVVRQLIAQQQASLSTPLVRFSTVCLIGTWVIGIADTYRVGKAQARSASN